MKLSILLSILSSGSLVFSASSPASKHSLCRCLAGDSCFPNTSAFSKLQTQVSQPLVHPVPPAAVCYPGALAGNCTAVLSNWGDGNWRANQVGASESQNFESYVFSNGTISACYKETSLGIPCGQGSVPVIGVDARSASDVQAAVEFAVKYNLKLVVKNTGHDYFGRSSGRGSFVVWTHNMKDIEYHATFVPQGAEHRAPSSTALTIGAGVQWHEAYDAVNAQNQTMVGGASVGGSVGAAGGWLMGGGHSALSPFHGLGVDNVLEMTVVIASGELLTVNEYQHTDLFWALRGGGGGTFGIVTSVTYRTYPNFGLIAGYFVASANNSDVMRKVFTEYVRIHPKLSDDGWSGYGSLNNNSMTVFYIMPNKTWDQAQASINPFFIWADALQSEGLTISSNATYPFPSFYSWYGATFALGEQNGINIQTGSRLLPRESFEKDYKRLADVMFDMGSLSLNFVGGGQLAKINPDSVAVNPAWRKTLVHITFGVVWPDGASVDVINKSIEVLKGKTASIRDITPTSGAYFNEASLYETNPQYTFFGDHYPALKLIKLKYDPFSLFVVQEGVGSEEWNSDLTCRRY
ncbi:hypothetical protein HYDPIDRAFT_106660 [Hydnomerulius pinastri MD-312]|nr:hypothetical protein HYDPIDRAFT_106660 [Hydnomerulius pinastri MD-312]